MSYMNDEQAQRILEKYENAFRELQSLKDEFSSHFRTLNTQR